MKIHIATIEYVAVCQAMRLARMAYRAFLSPPPSLNHVVKIHNAQEFHFHIAMRMVLAPALKTIMT